MTIRLPRLEALFGCRLDAAMSASAIRQLVEQAASEAEDLDFKAELYQPGDGELAKDVAAMANTLGGAIVIAVNEEHEVPVGAPGVEISAGHLRSMRATVRSRIRPFPSFEVLHIEDAPDHGFYVIVVASSAAAPFLVLTGTPDKPTFGYPRRRGSDTVWLGELEMAAAYRNRSLRAGEQRERVRQVSDDLLKRLRAEVPWLLLSLVPEVPGEFCLNTANQGRLTRWWYETRQRLGYQDMRCDARPDFRRVRLTTDDLNLPQLGYDSIECHVDGASSAAYLCWHARDDPVRLFEFDVSEKLLAALVVTGGFATELAACPGSCILELQLVGPGPETAVRQMQPARPYTAYVVPTMIPFAHVGKIPAVVASVELDDLVSAARSGRIAHELLSDLLSAFGHIEAKAIKEDGTVWADAWPAERRPALSPWMASSEELTS